MRISVPVSTVEKPLTAIDYIAALQECATTCQVMYFSARVPDAVRADERYASAVATRLNEINRRKRA